MSSDNVCDFADLKARQSTIGRESWTSQSVRNIELLASVSENDQRSAGRVSQRRPGTVVFSGGRSRGSQFQARRL